LHLAARAVLAEPSDQQVTSNAVRRPSILPGIPLLFVRIPSSFLSHPPEKRAWFEINAVVGHDPAAHRLVGYLLTNF